jgi:hypothetical protein
MKTPNIGKQKITPEDLKNENEFELLTEVSHKKLREFVVSQISEEKFIIRIYSIYQIVMISFFIFLLTSSIIHAFRGNPETLAQIGWAILFSLSVLIVIHELLHALAYWIVGAKNISFGSDLKKFIFYALADKQVIASGPFHLVALTPFVIVKIMCTIGALYFFNVNSLYFFLTVMCLHSLFCAGDMAMLAFYNLHRGKAIYNYDDKNEGKTYFYIRKNV